MAGIMGMLPAGGSDGLMNSLFGRRWVGWVGLALVLAGTAFFGRYARLDRIDNRLEDNVVSNETLAAYYRFLRVFGNDRILLVGFEAPAIDPGLVRRLLDAELALLRLDNVQSVLSPVSPLRTQFGIGSRWRLERFLGEPRQLERYLENLRKTRSYDRLIVSPDWKAGGIVIRLKAETGDLVEASLAEVRAVLQDRLTIPHHLTGIPEITRLILEMTRRDQKLFSPLSVLLIGIVLWALYRTWFGMAIPLLAIVSAFVWTKGLLIANGNSVNFVTSILPPMVLSIALTYCIHLLTYYYTLAEGQREFRPDLLAEAVRHEAHPVFLSVLTTVVGFGSLLSNDIYAIGVFGLYSSIGTLLSGVLAFLVIPAGVVAFRRVEATAPSIEGLEPRLARFAAGVIRHRWWVWVVNFVGLGLAAVGIARLPVETSLIRYLPDDHQIQAANRFVEERLCGIVPIEVLLESDGRRFTEPEVVHAVRRFQAEVASVSFCDRSLSYVDLLQDFDRMFSGEPDHVPATEEEIWDYLRFYGPPIEEAEEGEEDDGSGGMASTTFKPLPEGGLLPEFIASEARIAHVSLRFRDRSSKELVAGFREVERLVGKHFGGLGVRTTITGRAAMWAEVSEIIVWQEFISFFGALVVIFLVFVAYFRSWRVGAIGILPNILPTIYTFGIMGFTNTTFNTVTAMIGSIVIGLAVDDTLHLICEFRDELGKGAGPEDAIAHTMVQKGRATIFTSLVLTAGFSVLSFSGFGPTRYFGIFLSIAILTALAVELLVTPVALYCFQPFPRKERKAADGAAGSPLPASPCRAGPEAG